jgi:hypothetical protein
LPEGKILPSQANEYVKKVFPHLTMSPKDHPEIKKIITETVLGLKPKYPQLTERFLDVLIWDHMR